MVGGTKDDDGGFSKAKNCPGCPSSGHFAQKDDSQGNTNTRNKTNSISQAKIKSSPLSDTFHINTAH